MIDQLFIQSLENDDISGLMASPKGDLHNHAPRGGNIADIEQWAGRRLPRLDHKFDNLDQMQAWYKTNIRQYCTGEEGYDIRILSAFRQAARDGVTKLVLTFGLGEEMAYGSTPAFINRITEIKSSVAAGVDFTPEIAVGSDSDVDQILPACEECFSYSFFRSIDINGVEGAQPLKNFRPLYRLAKSHGLRLRAHVGEFGSADSIREAVELLELDEVQHGNTAAESKPVMRFLADNRIRLNLCPASNILLSRTENYNTHPIRRLFDAGIPVTINTDDMLIFNVGLSEMYRQFYRDGVFSAEELDTIRGYGLA